MGVLSDIATAIFEDKDEREDIVAEEMHTQVPRVGEFLKVSRAQFVKDFIDQYGDTPRVEEAANTCYDAIKIPQRATAGSAGYDFVSPVGVTLNPGETVKIATGIRAVIEPGWWLGILPRSSMGFKYQMALANTMGVVDEDYFGADNEGHIFIKIVNRGDMHFHIEAGERFAQGIFIPYGITYSDSASALRTGGMGSTNKG